METSENKTNNISESLKTSPQQTEPSSATAPQFQAPKLEGVEPQKNWLIYGGIGVLILLGLIILPLIFMFFTFFTIFQNIDFYEGEYYFDEAESIFSDPSFTIDDIEWLTYTAELNYDRQLTFKYPKGATVNTKAPLDEFCDDRIEITFEALTVRINDGPCGIGGLPTNYFTPFKIIAGDYYNGIGKTLSDIDFSAPIYLNYFSLFLGGLTEDALANADNFEASILRSSAYADSEYEKIADKIAISILDLDLEPKEMKGWAKFYQSLIPADAESSNSFYEKKFVYEINGVSSDGSSYSIFSDETTNMESALFAIINRTEDYLAILVEERNSAYSVLVHNFDSGEFVEIEGSIKLRAGTNQPEIEWLDNYILDLNIISTSGENTKSLVDVRERAFVD